MYNGVGLGERKGKGALGEKRTILQIHVPLSLGKAAELGILFSSRVWVGPWDHGSHQCNLNRSDTCYLWAKEVCLFYPFLLQELNAKTLSLGEDPDIKLGGLCP